MTINTTIDFATILEVSQTLFGCIQLSELLYQVTQIILQHSGGDRCALILPNQYGKWYLKAIATPETTQLSSELLDGNPNLPIKLIKYVRKTQKVLFINHSQTDLPFTDEYINQQQPKSALCLPLVIQGHLIGIIYLQSSINDLFVGDRLLVIKFLCTQAAISLKNTQLLHESQEAEITLEQNNAFLEAQLESCVDGILVTNGNRQLHTYNQKFASIWKIPKTILETKDERQLLGFLLEQLENPSNFLGKVEYLYVHPEETSYDEIILKDKRILKRVSTPVKLPSEVCYGRIWYFRDITERKKAEEASHLLFSVVESTDDAIITKTLDGIITSWNRAAMNLFGYSPTEVIGKPISILFPPERMSEEPQIIKRLKNGEKIEHFETVRLHKNGIPIHVSVTISPLRDDLRNIVGASTIIRDITERKKAEKVSHLLSSVVESTDDAIITKTLDGIITSWNRAAMNLFGYSPTEVIGKPISILFPPERMSEEPQIIKRLKNGEKIEHFETVRLHKNGTPIHVSVTISPLRDDLRNIAGASKIVRDITNRKQVEAAVMQKSQELEQTLGELQKAQLQIVQSEKMAALGNLVAGVAHEINNPVGFLYGSINNSKEYIQNLFDHIKCYQENHPTPDNAVIKHAKNIDLEYIYEDLPKLLNSMNIAAERITKISHSLRIFSRTDTSKKVTCNIHESINSTILILKYRLKANDKRPAIAVIKDYGELHTAKCFLGQLNQVFMNILVNAIDMFDEMAQTQTFEEIKANPQQITISTKVAANHRIFIRIRDNGKGMTNEIQAQIFDNLFTTKGVGKGTGLGLAIVRQIIEEIHGGKLICKSRLGEGTEFLIELPFE